MYYVFEELRKIHIPVNCYRYLYLDPYDLNFQNGINAYKNYRSDFYSNMLLKYAYSRQAVDKQGISMLEFLSNGGTFSEMPADSFSMQKK